MGSEVVRVYRCRRCGKPWQPGERAVRANAKEWWCGTCLRANGHKLQRSSEYTLLLSGIGMLTAIVGAISLGLSPGWVIAASGVGFLGTLFGLDHLFRKQIADAGKPKLPAAKARSLPDERS